MSIPMLVLEDIVGKVESLLMFVVEMLKRLRRKLDLFAMFPIGATMQDGSKRKEAMHVTAVACLFIVKENKRKIKEKKY